MFGLGDMSKIATAWIVVFYLLRWQQQFESQM
jgi:hypothetical protein